MSMRPENLKRVHWIIISIILGAGLAWLYGLWGLSATQTNPQSQLEQLLVQQPAKKADDGTLCPYARDIIIYPSQPAGFAVQRNGVSVIPRKSVVTYNILVAVAEGSKYKPAVSLVDEPYRPGGMPSDDPDLTFQDYLNELSVGRDWITYRYAWWTEPDWSYTLWIGGSFLLLGVIWPTVQNKLIEAGYGRAPEPSTGESLFSILFSRKAKPSRSSDDGVKAKARPTGLSDEELERINKMEADLAGFVKSGSKTTAGEADEAAAPAIKNLSSGPLAEQAAPEAPKEEQDYGGEFYPTVAHGRKKSDKD